MNPIINTSTKKYAVLIGINYFNTASQLNGCINDALHLKSFLTTKANYLPENIVTLVDDGTATMPTKQNIINSFNTLIAKANEGFTELFLSCSSHGSYIVDTNNDELDRQDEVICPVDYANVGMISDDFIYENLIVKLPATVTLFALMDSCYSGSIFDLPFIYNLSFTTNNNHSSHVASVVSISGCRDDQTSADSFMNNVYQGAMTWSFLKAIEDSQYNIKIVDLVKNMRLLLAGKFTQVPLLAVSSSLEYDRQFMQPATITPVIVPIISPVSIKPIKFTLTTDYWFKESSWNVWSFVTNKYIFDKNNVFLYKNQTVTMTKYLPVGQYKLCINDTYGDGGVTAVVSYGLTKLVSTKVYTGKLAEYHFKV